MPQSESQYLQLKDHVGVTADGNLEPLVAIGLVIPVPVMIPNPVTKIPEPGETAESITVEPADQLGMQLARIVPGTRVIEVCDFRIAGALLHTGNWEQVAKPTPREAAAAAKALTDASQEAGTHTDTDDQPVNGQEA